MKRKTTILAVLAIAGLALSTLLVSAFTALPLPNLLASYTQDNIDVRNLDRVNFRSNYEELDNKAGWLIEIGLEGDENIYGIIDKENVEEKSEKEPKNDLRIDTYGFDKYLAYELVQGDRVTFLEHKQIDCSWGACKQEARDECRNWAKEGDNYHYDMQSYPVSGWVDYKLSCFRKRDVGHVYGLSTERKKWSSTLKLSAGGDAVTADVSDSDNRNVEMESGGEVKAFIDGIYYNIGEMAINPGNIVKFATCNDNDCGASSVLLKNYYFDEYDDGRQNLDSCVSSDNIKSKQDALSCRNTYMETVPGYMETGWYTGDLKGTMKYDKSNDWMEYRGPEVTFTPSIQLYVLGPDFLGIYEAVVKPRIESLSSPKIKELSDGVVVVDVKNDANVGGEFSLSGVCDPGASIKSGEGQKNIEADEIKSYNFGVRTEDIGVDKKKVTCKVTVSSEAVTDTKETEISVVDSDEPTREYCNDGKDNDGDGLADCEDPDCKNLPICQNGGEKICDDGRDNDQDGLIDCADPDCRDAEACGGPGINWMAVGLIMVLAIGGAGAYWWWRKKR